MTAPVVDPGEAQRLFAYADPPYYGYSSFYDHPDAARWDNLDAHRTLIADLSAYNGWAMSMTSGNLHDILPLCPRSARVAAWVKPFASFKKNVNPHYTALHGTALLSNSPHPSNVEFQHARTPRRWMDGLPVD